MRILNKKVVQKALEQTWESENTCRVTWYKAVVSNSSMISRLIYDIFGGNILKICKKKGLYFYNYINGELIDFTIHETDNFLPENILKGQPATPAETRNYYAQEDYITFYTRFINSFEEIVGLKKCQGRKYA